MASLYVFLHGLFVVAERATDLEIALPDVPGHVFRAGTWLAETAIQQGGVLRLGVPPPTAPPVRPWGPAPSTRRSVPATVYLDQCRLNSGGRAATVWLPKPDGTLALLLGTPTIAGHN